MEAIQSGRIIVYGDAFVDYIATDRSNTEFNRHLGGATVNVAAGLARLGTPSSFITVTGDDEAGRFAREGLLAEGVGLDLAVLDPGKRVVRLYIHLDESGERVFHTYHDETPAIQVRPGDIPAGALEGVSLLHLASGTMFHPAARETTERLVELAGAGGVPISVDANIRPARWADEETCRKTVSRFIEEASIVKMTKEELSFLTGTESLDEGLQLIRRPAHQVLFITDGANGTHGMLGGSDLGAVHVPATAVRAVDTTGAGDAFMAGILHFVRVRGMPGDRDALIRCAEFGNRLGAMAVTRKGALTALPHAGEPGTCL
ncbi:carbohydrate kinase family protein [Bhargavaea cecembensis]|uniref:carbohydrate kinase family protein n=1 Tax=Bhargavaea cecembensis TaxID=394098 RepID=UPI000590B7C9|nr:carbohydrate kinase [Bhargavaea cecembensis]